MNDNEEAAGTVDEKKAAVEEAEKPYKAWNEGIGQFWKLDIEVDKKRKPKLIISELNKFLASEEHCNRPDYQLEKLVPSWNGEAPLTTGKKLKKQLKKAQKLGSEETFDAREHQPCVIFGIDEDNFSQEAWNAGLDVDEEGWVMPKEGLFNTIEVDFEGLEDSDDDSDDSDDDNINLLIALRLPYPGGDEKFAEEVRVPLEEAQAALEAAETAYRVHHQSKQYIPEVEAAIADLEAQIEAAKTPEPEPEPEPSDHWYKLEFEVDKKCKPKKIIAAVNKLLEEHGMQVEQLVPLWTPDYTALEGGKKLVKQLKHSKKGDDEDYDARKEDPVRLIAVDMEQFDATVWNEHLDFGGDEFEKHEISFEDLEDSDASDSSSDSNLTIQVGIRVIY